MDSEQLPAEGETPEVVCFQQVSNLPHPDGTLAQKETVSSQDPTQELNRSHLETGNGSQEMEIAPADSLVSVETVETLPNKDVSLIGESDEDFQHPTSSSLDDPKHDGCDHITDWVDHADTMDVQTEADGCVAPEVLGDAQGLLSPLPLQELANISLLHQARGSELNNENQESSSHEPSPKGESIEVADSDTSDQCRNTLNETNASRSVDEPAVALAESDLVLEETFAQPSYSDAHASATLGSLTEPELEAVKQLDVYLDKAEELMDRMDQEDMANGEWAPGAPVVAPGASIQENAIDERKIESTPSTIPASLTVMETEVTDSTNAASSHSAEQAAVSEVAESSNSSGSAGLCVPVQESMDGACDIDPTTAAAGSFPPSSDRTNITGDEPTLLHHIKTIQFKDKKVGIVTQNENGPCPLVAIINVLLLRRQIGLPANSEIVTAGKLMEHIGNAILESVPKNLSGEARLDYEQNMMDAMAVLPKLQTGLDVNVKFTGVKDFEYTPECIIFDLLGLLLYHGWLVDPQDKEVVSVIGQMGYNQLVEKVIGQKTSTDPDAATEALIIENFLERSASQLTYHGLSELNESMADDEIAVLFRNNHFSTIYKNKNELFQLVTDQGFLGEPNVVWETLSSIDGDGQFVDGQFHNVPPKPEHSMTSVVSGNTSSPNTSAQLSMTAEQQIDHDFLVALSLQEEQQGQQTDSIPDFEGVNNEESVLETTSDKSAQELLDLELAKQLQEEEVRHAAAVERETAEMRSASGQQDQASRPSSRQDKAKNKCILL